MTRRVLLIGWDAADWKVIHPLLDAGQMPNLEKLVDQGVIGNLSTLYPDLSPMLWTSIATGKQPYKHGIVGFTEPDPQSGGIRPVTNISRRTKAVWNILSQAGKRSVVLGWWPSHPAEPIAGVMVSNRYTRVIGPVDRPLPLLPGTVWPEGLSGTLAGLRMHPLQVSGTMLEPFVPRADTIDREKDGRLEAVARTICDCTNIQRAARHLLSGEPWDFAAVYFDAIDHFCHGFMKYHPPRLDWIPEEDHALYREVVREGYRLHDRHLGELLELLGEDDTVILVSDHGFESGPLRPRHLPMEPAGPAAEHRHFGIFVMKGPGVRRDDRVYGASLLDVCPTILALFGLPIGQDMDGKPLLDAFSETPELASIPSWDPVPGKAGMHRPDREIDAADARDAIRQLVSLGYIEEPDPDQKRAVTEASWELDYNRARSYMNAGLWREAAALFEGLVAASPGETRFAIRLVTCYESMGRIAEARRLLEDTLAQKRKVAASAAEELAAWQKAREGEEAGEISPEEHRRVRALQKQAAFNPFAAESLLGSLKFAEGDEAGALEHLERAERMDARQPAVYLRLGPVYLRMRRWDDAERCFSRVLELDPDNAQGYLGLCETHLSRERNQEAAEAALDALGLTFYNPRGHLLLARALERLDDLEGALRALKIAVSQNPDLVEAHQRLSDLYKTRFHDHLKAGEHQLLAREGLRKRKALREGGPGESEHGLFEPAFPVLSEPADAAPENGHPQEEPEAAVVDLADTVTIVSGLPRSGTSMMMQMLQAGGLEVLTDGKRAADEDNPRGYFEFERARNLRKDAAWLPEARGKAVKIVAQLLRFVGPDLPHRVILMHREIGHVLESQQRMLRRQGKAASARPDADLAGVFSRQVADTRALLRSRGIPVLVVAFDRCLADPSAEASRINRFLGGALDERAMAARVDAGLRRSGAGQAEGAGGLAPDAGRAQP